MIANFTWAVCCALDFDLSVTGAKSLVSWGDCFLQDDFPLGVPPLERCSVVRVHCVVGRILAALSSASGEFFFFMQLHSIVSVSVFGAVASNASVNSRPSLSFRSVGLCGFAR